jgi:hypothetical protein
MEFTADQLKRAVQLGALGYGAIKSANVLEVEDIDEFLVDFNNPISEFQKYYQKGVDMADFAIDAKLFDMAKNGNLQAMKEFEIRKSRLQQNEKDKENSRKLRENLNY